MSDQKRVEETIVSQGDSTAKEFRHNIVEPDFLGGAVSYVEFASEQFDENDAFYYVLTTKDQVRLFDDGMQVIQVLKTMLDRRRTFWQRLTEFTFTEFIAAMIASVLTLAFVLALFSEQAASIVEKLSSIVAVIIGYYFGRFVQVQPKQ
jgi:hypothetical protein